jgi:small conductance mechanosensitive channel
MPNWLTTLLALPVLGTALKLLLVLLLFVAVRQGLRLGHRQAERRLQQAVLDSDRRTRLQTLLRAGYGVAVGVAALIVVTMALQLAGLNIGPLLASAGVVGLAISLGASTLIRDYLGGVLILAEDQFRVGDVIEVSGAAGEVVRMTLRVTYLRDVYGKLYTVPNGDIRVIGNMTREWARAVVDLNLEYGADMAQATKGLSGAIERLRADETVRDFLLDEPSIVSWNNLTDWAVQVRLMARTLPGKQWAVGQALRRYAVEALAGAGVRVALPVTTLREGGNS